MNKPLCEIEEISPRHLRVLIRGQYVLDGETGEPAVYVVPVIGRKRWEQQFKRTLQRLCDQ